jgi:hypothetical protein
MTHRVTIRLPDGTTGTMQRATAEQAWGAICDRLDDNREVGGVWQAVVLSDATVLLVDASWIVEPLRVIEGGPPETAATPAWVECEDCDDYVCTIHRQHTADCPCPPIEEWDVDPYSEGGESDSVSSVFFEPE